MQSLPAFDLDTTVTMPYSNAVMERSQQVNRTKIFRPASFRERIVAVIVCLGVTAYFAAFALAGRNDVDIGRYVGYCGFRQRTNLPCPTCGMTTATLAFARGNIWEAFQIQPAAGMLYSAAVIAAVIGLLIGVSGLYPNLLERTFRELKLGHVILALAVILACGWAVTLARALAAQN